jgi:hypothetical protein
MSFQDILARDMAHIISGTNSEFGVDVDYWAEGADVTTDAADDTVKGIRFEMASDRRDDTDGQNAKREVSVLIEKAQLATIDDKGFIGINDVIYSIRHVGNGDGATWRVHACVDEAFEYGRGNAIYGG